MSAIRLLRALSKEVVLLLEVDEVEDVEEVASSEKREVVLCKLEINMRYDPFLRKISRGSDCRKAAVPRAIYVDCISMRNEDKRRRQRKSSIP
jgi:hypothetical protein